MIETAYIVWVFRIVCYIFPERVWHQPPSLGTAQVKIARATEG